MTTRNPIDVINQITALIPQDKVGLHGLFNKLKQDASYKAPEQHLEVFVGISEILTLHIREPIWQWQKDVVDVFEDRNDWRVFRMNDCDWYMARSLTDAVKHYAEDTKVPMDELLSDPRELSWEEMESLRYHPEGNRNGESVSFKAELLRRIHAGPRVELFATTEF